MCPGGGRRSARLGRQIVNLEVAGSNPVGPAIIRHSPSQIQVLLLMRDGGRSTNLNPTPLIDLIVLEETS